MIHSMDVIFMWAATVWEQQVKPRVLEVTLNAAAAKASRSQHPWRTASTPADAALLTMQRLGWRLHGPFQLESDEKVQYDLRRLGPRQVQEEVRKGAVRASDRMAPQSTGKALGSAEGETQPSVPIF